MKTNCAFSIKTACAEARRKEHGPPSNDDPVIPSLLVVLRNTGFGKDTMLCYGLELLVAVCLPRSRRPSNVILTQPGTRATRPLRSHPVA